ncbi:MAG: hypothetical protein K6G48_02090 [Acholeplasmatales bacterium]|nr:hypothetical protein [Acholeplasmatales bacterium]
MNRVSFNFIKGNKRLFKAYTIIIALFLFAIFLFSLFQNYLSASISNYYSSLGENRIVSYDSEAIIPSDYYYTKSNIYSFDSSIYIKIDDLGNKIFLGSSSHSIVCDDISIYNSAEFDRMGNDGENNGIYINEKDYQSIEEYLGASPINQEISIYLDGISYDVNIAGVMKRKNVKTLISMDTMESNSIFIPTEYAKEKNIVKEDISKVVYTFDTKITLDMYNSIISMNAGIEFDSYFNYVSFYDDIVYTSNNIFLFLISFVSVVGIMLFLLLNYICYYQTIRQRYIYEQLGITKRDKFIFNFSNNAIVLGIAFVSSIILVFMVGLIDLYYGFGLNINDTIILALVTIIICTILNTMISLIFSLKKSNYRNTNLFE